MYHMNAHPRMASAEKDFNIQVARMASSVGTSQPSLPTTCVIAYGLMNKVAPVAGMEVMHGLGKRDFHSPRLTWLWPLPLSNLPIAKMNSESLIQTIPWGAQPATWWQVDYTRPLPSWKGQHFVLAGIDFILDMGLPFLHEMMLSKLPSVS